MRGLWSHDELNLTIAVGDGRANIFDRDARGITEFVLAYSGAYLHNTRDVESRCLADQGEALPSITRPDGPRGVDCRPRTRCWSGRSAARGQAAPETPPPGRVLALDVADDGRAGPGQERRNDKPNAFFRPPPVPRSPRPRAVTSWRPWRGLRGVGYKAQGRRPARRRRARRAARRNQQDRDSDQLGPWRRPTWRRRNGLGLPPRLTMTLLSVGTYADAEGAGGLQGVPDGSQGNYAARASAAPVGKVGLVYAAALLQPVSAGEPTRQIVTDYEELIRQCPDAPKLVTSWSGECGRSWHGLGPTCLDSTNMSPE